MTFPVYVLRLLGVRDLIVTNACGGINRSFAPGDLMLVTDYINMLGQNSLMGDNDPQALDRDFRICPNPMPPNGSGWLSVWRRSGQSPIRRGFMPCSPAPAMKRQPKSGAYAALGADAIGMSTVPETIAANYLGMGVLGVACITNMATGIAKEKHTHEEYSVWPGRVSKTPPLAQTAAAAMAGGYANGGNGTVSG